MSHPKCLHPELSDGIWSPPLDVADLATRLEAEGVTPAVARAKHGFADVWAMAEAWFPKLQAVPSPRKKDPAPQRKWPEYLRGMSFGLPLLLSCVAMLWLHFSLWGGNLPTETATAVGAGSITSFVLTGGFVQVMARRGLFYLGTKQFERCWRSTWFWVRACFLTNLCFVLLFTMVNLYFGWLPNPLGPVAMSFCVCLGVYWLATGILYMLDQYLLVSVSSLLGISAVVALHTAFGVELLPAQLIAILFASCLAFLMAAAVLKKRALGVRSVQIDGPVNRQFSMLWPYFAYGTLYYFFLFSDRLLAWTAHTNTASLVLAFRGEYELASFIGLLAFILQAGWVHLATARFYKNVRLNQASINVYDRGTFNRNMLRFYAWQAGVFFPAALLVSVSIYTCARMLHVFPGELVDHVAAWALAGYPFLVFGLWNVSLLFGLSRSSCALQAIASACCANLVTGYLASRLGGYELAVSGFTCGAIVFAVVAGRHCVETFRRLDYYYLAAAI